LKFLKTQKNKRELAVIVAAVVEKVKSETTSSGASVNTEELSKKMPKKSTSLADCPARGDPQGSSRHCH
jgi:hypothetical protein